MKMKTYSELTAKDKELIRKAYQFEIDAIEADSAERNPYADKVKALGLWDAINIAVELKYNPT